MIVAKAVNMAKKMNIPILGLVENMSYLECPDCGKKISVFGESHIDEIAKEHELPVLAKLPIDPVIAKHVDEEMCIRDRMASASHSVAWFKNRSIRIGRSGVTPTAAFM